MLKDSNRTKIIALFPFLLFIVSFFVKILYLTSQDISLDEPFTIYHAQFPVSSIIEQLKNYNNPPLYELVLHFWIKVFGISAFSVRMLPLLFACLSPVALYYFAKKNFSLNVGITSSLLLTFSNLLMYYAQDCRVYSLFLLLSILSIHFYLNTYNDTSGKNRNRLFFILTTTLLLYAHYFGAFILFFQGLHLLIFNLKKLKSFLLYYFIILGLYSPHIYVLIKRLGDSVSQGTWLEPPGGIESLYNMLWSFSNYPFITVACIAILVLAFIKFLWHKPIVTNLGLNSLILIWFLIPFLGMYFISFWIPMYIGRYLIFALPAYYISLTLCINYLFKENRTRNVFLTGLILCFVFTLDLNPNKKQPVSDALSTLKEFKTPSTAVVVYPDFFLPTFAYNYNKNYFSAISDNEEYKLTDSLLRQDDIYHILTSDQLLSVLQKPYENVLFFTQGGERNSIEDTVFKSLSTKSTLKWKKQVGPNWYISSFKLTKRD